MASTPEPPYPNRTEVFVVLHYVETELCPEPLSEHAGLNVQKTVCVYNTQLYADRHAMRYAEDRRLTLHLPPDAIEPGEKYDYSDVPGKIRQKELVWVERQWRDGVF